MQHENFYYKEDPVDLSHLQQTSADFTWLGKNSVTHTYRVWLRYSCHAYSRNLDIGEEVGEDDYIVETTPKLRIYCPKRYSQTQRLVAMMGGLFEKPTSRVALTHDNNWTTFQLYLPAGGGAQHRYCAFFTVKNSRQQPDDPELHFLEMHVESGYIKESIVKTVRGCTFGEVAYMTKYEIPYK